MPHAAVLTIGTAVAAMLPFCAVIAVAIAALLALAHSQLAALVIFAFGLVVIFIADHFVRPKLIGGATHMPFLLVLFGILGGIETWGLIGLFIGPALMAVVSLFWAGRHGHADTVSALMLAEKINAKQALEWGLAYAVAPDTEVVTQAQAVARRLASGPCAVLGQIRSLHTSSFDNSLQEQLRAERSAQEMTLETHDCVEGVRAFFEKREPHFSDR